MPKNVYSDWCLCFKEVLRFFCVFFFRFYPATRFSKLFCNFNLAPFNYRGWEYTGMDQDEEEEDFGEEDEEEEEEEEDIFIRDKRKVFGDTSHYCPVMLKDKNVLWPGIAECAAKYRERTYFFSSTEARATFLANPASYLPIDRPLEVSSGFRWPFVFTLTKG